MASWTCFLEEKKLENDRTLAECKITSGHTLTMFIADPDCKMEWSTHPLNRPLKHIKILEEKKQTITMKRLNEKLTKQMMENNRLSQQLRALQSNIQMEKRVIHNHQSMRLKASKETGKNAVNLLNELITEVAKQRSELNAQRKTVKESQREYTLKREILRRDETYLKEKRQLWKQHHEQIKQQQESSLNKDRADLKRREEDVAQKRTEINQLKARLAEKQAKVERQESAVQSAIDKFNSEKVVFLKRAQQEMLGISVRAEALKKRMQEKQNQTLQREHIEDIRVLKAIKQCVMHVEHMNASGTIGIHVHDNIIHNHVQHDHCSDSKHQQQASTSSRAPASNNNNNDNNNTNNNIIILNGNQSC